MSSSQQHTTPTAPNTVEGNMAKQPNFFLMWWWQRRIARMKRCRTLDELRVLCGEPNHKVVLDAMDFWHYTLRPIGETLYSIHVAVIDNRPNQVYLHMEPITDTPES
jgi:hypothetical protein